MTGYERTDKIAQIAAATSKMQAMLSGAKKSGDNPHFHSHHSTLADCWDACRLPLTSNGLSIVQPVSIGADGAVQITTVLLHDSGEYISSTLEMRPAQDDPQSRGSVITYGRRYGICAMVGIAPEDDDAEAGMVRPASTTGSPPTRHAGGRSSPAGGRSSPVTLQASGDVVTDTTTGESVTLGEGTCLITDVTERTLKSGSMWSVAMTGIDRESGGGLTTVRITTFEARVATLAELYKNKLIPVRPETKKSQDGQYTNLVGLTPVSTDGDNTVTGRAEDIDHALGDAVEAPPDEDEIAF
jgi:hypothetical protein